MRCKVKGRVTAIGVGVLVVGVAVGLALGIGRRPGGWPRFRHRVLGCRPDPSVEGATLADRIRSTIGPLEKQLDLPRVHVLVEGHSAILHGDVGWPHEAASVEQAVRAVSGVERVESHLHVGLLPGDARPSAGREATERMRAQGQVRSPRRS